MYSRNEDLCRGKRSFREQPAPFSFKPLPLSLSALPLTCEKGDSQKRVEEKGNKSSRGGLLDGSERKDGGGEPESRLVSSSLTHERKFRGTTPSRPCHVSVALTAHARPDNRLLAASINLRLQLSQHGTFQHHEASPSGSNPAAAAYVLLRCERMLDQGGSRDISSQG